jgi:hypothetical protein
MFRLGEMIALAEGAAAAARRAARAAQGTPYEKSDARFDAETLAVVARIAAREASLRVTVDGLRWAVGCADAGGSGAGASAPGLPEAVAAQAGLMADMDRMADALYGRDSAMTRQEQAR